MIRNHVFLATLALLAMANSVVGQASSPTPEHILVTASDKNGNPVTLSASALSLVIGGKPAVIREVKSANDVPLDFVVMMDLSGSNRDKISFQRDAIRQTFQALATGSNRGYLGGFNDEVWMTTRPLHMDEVDTLLNRIVDRGGTAMNDAIAYACSQLAQAQTPDRHRRIVVLFTDGIDNASHIPIEEAIREAEKSGVAIFAVQLSTPEPNRRGDQALKAITRRTGGNLVKIDRPMPFVDRLLWPVKTQYFVDFSPAASFPGMVLSIEAKANDRAVQIIAPMEYIQP